MRYNINKSDYDIYTTSIYMTMFATMGTDEADLQFIFARAPRVVATDAINSG